MFIQCHVCVVVTRGDLKSWLLLKGISVTWIKTRGNKCLISVCMLQFIFYFLEDNFMNERKKLKYDMDCNELPSPTEGAKLIHVKKYIAVLAQLLNSCAHIGTFVLLPM